MEEAAITEASAKRVAASETTEFSIPSEMRKLASKAVGMGNTMGNTYAGEKASSAKKDQRLELESENLGLRQEVEELRNTIVDLNRQ
eukprot:TRINITY_DN18413_c0_g1_i1.p1 TRINITY_DN18413_c0_g1~~TRINITY_DN18413_c0_g1_i1.p1  ORF type:complete len:102 (+),score=27.17 TRINITY_DN18413_c0_g1_i1:47-307(+)